MLRLSERQAKQLGLMEHELTDVQAGEPGPERVRGASAEDLFAQQCVTFRLPSFIRQHPFALGLGRKWRFDFALLDFHLAVEIEGLIPCVIWQAKLDGGAPIMNESGTRVVNVRSCERQFVVFGRHASIKGIKGDMEKYNTAAALGWTVLRFEQKDVKPKHAIEMTMRALAAKGWKP